MPRPVFLVKVPRTMMSRKMRPHMIFKGGNAFVKLWSNIKRVGAPVVRQWNDWLSTGLGEITSWFVPKEAKDVTRRYAKDQSKKLLEKVNVVGEKIGDALFKDGKVNAPKSLQDAKNMASNDKDILGALKDVGETFKDNFRPLYDQKAADEVRKKYVGSGRGRRRTKKAQLINVL